MSLLRPVTRSVMRSVTRGVMNDGVAEALIAYWDWSGGTPFVSSIGSHTLVQGAGSTVTTTTGGPTNTAIAFDGTTDFLVIGSADIGDLNLGAQGINTVTVFAWFDRDDTNTGFLLGAWQEDDADPRRQYGLFLDLPTYGGDEQVCGHISKTGGATPGYPYSRDYSANSRRLENANWQFACFTYDGFNSRAYLGPMFDSRPTFTDDHANTYSKNPYPFADGLNATPVDFTVGAVKLTAGMSNFFQGKIGPMGVYNYALSLAEITDLYRSYLAGGAAVYDISFYTAVNCNARNIGWGCASASTIYTDNATATPHEYFGSAVGGGREFLVRLTSSVDVPLVAWSPDMDGVLISALTSVTFLLNSAITNSLLRLVIKSGGVWYATDETFDMVVPGVSATDWSLAVTKTFTFNLTAAKWRDLTFTPGSALSLAGAARSVAVPDGTLQNIGLYSPTRGLGSIRIDDFKVFA